MHGCMFFHSIEVSQSPQCLPVCLFYGCMEVSTGTCIQHAFISVLTYS